ncbi:MAG: hypothetical protein ABSB33_01460 [Tepidisphaeraceae bacterium]|jgi:hypothetical protein
MIVASIRHPYRVGGIVWLILSLALPTSADDIDGVQPAAMDQPRINLVIRRQASGQPLIGKSAVGDAFNVEAFLDTGASSIALSAGTAQSLGIRREMIAKQEARFQDVGVGGGSEFAVSEPIFLSLAPMAPNVDVEQKDAVATTYTLTVGPDRAEIGPLGGATDFLTSLALGDMDIVGMPALAGKIVVLDPRDVNSMSDKIRTYVYDAKSAAADHAPIPRTSQHVKLNFVSYSRFTKISPAGAQPPAISANPMIDANVSHHGKTSTGAWLLDTGAAASMISRRQAAELGVTYAAGSDGTAHPRLGGVPADRQFIMSVGGIGGIKKSAGFFLDKLSIPTIEGPPIVFDHAPVLVCDITVTDSAGKQFTLDGVFGMNFLVASAMVDESGLIPDIDHLTPGAFRWIVLNQPEGWLGVQRNP